MLLTISIITRNRREDLEVTLKSILKQNYNKNNYEIIIVNNDSNYNVKKQVDQILKGKKVNYQIYDFEENQGPVGGRNFSFLKANGKYVLFFDDDIIIKDNNFLNKIINIMENNKDIALLQTKIFNIKDNEYQKPVYKEDNYPFNPSFNYIGCNHIVRKTVFKEGETLYFDKLFYRNEETYLSLKIYDKGYKIIYYPETEIIHNPSSKRMAQSKIDIYNFVNGFMIKKLMYPWYLMPLIYIIITLRMMKNFKFDRNKYQQFIKLSKHRNMGNHKIKNGTVLKLIKIFGIMNVINW